MEIRDKRIVVTGGAGFLGRHLVERLLGWREVFVPCIEEYDLTRVEAIERLFERQRPEVLIHLAAVVGGIGRGQLEVLDLRVAQRRAIAFRYRDAFLDIPGISLMPQAPYGLHTNWLSCFLIEEEAFGCSRDELIGRLDRAGIESRPVWKPMHLQPLYASAARYGGEVAEDLFRRGICLPSSSSLTLEEQGRVIGAVKNHRRGAEKKGLVPAVGAEEVVASNSRLVQDRAQSG